ncbi:MAG: hypothetical protein QM784_06300 [Polyangiaceae bacterium]
MSVRSRIPSQLCMSTGYAEVFDRQSLGAWIPPNGQGTLLGKSNNHVRIAWIYLHQAGTARARRDDGRARQVVTQSIEDIRRHRLQRSSLLGPSLEHPL